MSEFQDSFHFEDEVRRVARELWSYAYYSGASIIDDKERDGIFETEECFHCLEASTSRAKVNAQKNGEKLYGLISKFDGSDKMVQGWYITRDEPTADQRDAIKDINKKKHVKITILSFAQFESKLIDASEYLRLRDNHPFGSIHNPNTGVYDFKGELRYIDYSASDSAGNILSVKDISDLVSSGNKIELVGDFGAGKSMTLREVYKLLKKKYYSKSTGKFPVYINLREHQKQEDIADILTTHARKIGFKLPHHLVKAWKAGYVHLILDGFDELMVGSILSKRKKLRDYRFSTLKPIRECVSHHNDGSGLVIAGRDQYFDGQKDRFNSLSTLNFYHIKLNDFSEEQIEKFLSVYNVSANIPSWLPSRPLLLGTLILKGYLRENKSLDVNDPSVGWEILLNEIVEREARIEVGLDGEAIRSILEHLAIQAKTTSEGIGPLQHEDICEAFITVCGYYPDDEAMTILLRLPGLGYDASEEGARNFVDRDFEDICASSFICKYIEAPYNYQKSMLKHIQHSLSQIGVDFSYNKIQNFTQKQIENALTFSNINFENGYLVNDIVNMCMASNKIISQVVEINGIGGYIEIEDDVDMSNILYKDCVFEYVELPSKIIGSYLPHFSSCLISTVHGVSSRNNIDLKIFDDACEINSYKEAFKTTDGILDMDINVAIKVLMSILKKLYLQSGSGRLENAFSKGLDQNAKRFVPDVLRILQTEKLAIKLARSGKEIWLADKKNLNRVAKILNFSSGLNDPVLLKVSNL